MYHFVFVVVTFLWELLTLPSQYVNTIRGHVGDFIIIPLFTYKTHTYN